MTDTETADDIIREMRELGALDAQCNDMIPRSLQALGLRTYADRFEAARKREREMAKEMSKKLDGNRVISNASAMRALELAVDYSEYIVDHLPDEFAGEIHAASEILETCDAALAAPPRNCDVGTAEEQRNRFEAFCEAHWSAIDGMCDVNCPCLRCGDKMVCLCKWAQMPYTEGGAQ